MTHAVIPSDRYGRMCDLRFYMLDFHRNILELFRKNPKVVFNFALDDLNRVPAYKRFPDVCENTLEAQIKMITERIKNSRILHHSTNAYIKVFDSSVDGELDKRVCKVLWFQFCLNPIYKIENGNTKIYISTYELKLFINPAKLLESDNYEPKY